VLWSVRNPARKKPGRASSSVRDKCRDRGTTWYRPETGAYTGLLSQLINNLNKK
jgi:hypothetical protein